MTWEELKEKAKKLGYRLREDDGDAPYLDSIIEYLENDSVDMTFYDDGLIETNFGSIVAENRTHDQMYQIMLALR